MIDGLGNYSMYVGQGLLCMLDKAHYVCWARPVLYYGQGQLCMMGVACWVRPAMYVGRGLLGETHYFVGRGPYGYVVFWETH